ncbi:MAG: DMT family transporter [Xanthomonadales bacterium]|nr:DMT family transporter [Xanthomonadales bacterium]
MNHAIDRKATLGGFIAILLWSSLALLTNLTGDLPPFLVLAISFGCGGIIGLLHVLRQGKAGLQSMRAPLPALTLSTAGLFGYHALYFFSLKHAPPVEANLLNYLWPLLIVLLSGLLPGIHLRTGNFIGAVLGLIAAALLVTGGRGIRVDPAAGPGYLAAIAAALVWAGYSVRNRRYAHVPSAAIVPACIAVAILGAFSHFAFEPSRAITGMQWLAMLAMGVGPVGAAFWLWDNGTKRGDIALLGGLSYLAPLLSTLLLVASGRAQPHWIQAVAIALLLTGAWSSLRASRLPVDNASSR